MNEEEPGHEFTSLLLNQCHLLLLDLLLLLLHPFGHRGRHSVFNVGHILLLLLLDCLLLLILLLCSSVEAPLDEPRDDGGGAE